MVDTRIHTAIHVCNLVHSFVVNQTVVQCLNGLLASNKVVTTATLVTHTPEDNTGVITVAQHHAFLTIYVLTLP